jgi:hypothetical protein
MAHDITSSPSRVHLTPATLPDEDTGSLGGRTVTYGGSGLNRPLYLIFGGVLTAVIASCAVALFAFPHHRG